jgi:outer membrane protein
LDLFERLAEPVLKNITSKYKEWLLKYLWKTAIAAALFWIPAQADLLRVSAGAGLWKAAPTGTLRYEETDYRMSAEDQLGYEAEQMPYLWADLKHAVPFAPNLRLEYTKVTYEGNTQGLINWWGWNLYLSDSAWSEMEVDEYDAILYYNLFDTSFGLSLDAGLDTT